MERTYRVDNAVSIFAGKIPQITFKQQHLLMHTVIPLSFYYRSINLPVKNALLRLYIVTCMGD
jgi:hypothetical protein